ncbi:MULTISPECIES: roadblock/LC7 domain-containing protein [Streptomyces]|uniref:roadblock/LC7 domain-containing protein n=1 Tax=Streptomyces TaxID=1883 RepID=UPI0004CCC670|nr:MULTISPECIES: roadblock/LC7 domain-containing protein [Streptomyces]KOT52683.1 hypothetical protein ADK43_29895 [Streptomyces rimosus subsp. rimosus]
MTHNMDWMVKCLTEVPSVRHVAAMTSDGLLTACSPGLDRDIAERLSAACSGYASLAKGTAGEFGTAGPVGGPNVRQVVVEFTGGFLFLRLVGAACVAVITDPQVDPGQVGLEMQVQAQKLGKGLQVPPRQDTPA